MSKKAEKLQEQRESIAQTWAVIKALQETVVGEDRDYTTEEKGKIEAGLDAIRGSEEKITELQKDAAMDERIKYYEKMFAGSLPGAKKEDRQAGTVGRQFVESDEWKSWMANVAAGGRIPDSMKGLNSPPVSFKNIGLFDEQKALVTGLSDTSAGAFVVSDRTGIYEPIGRYPLNLRSLITVRQTGSDTVEYVRQTTQITQAATVPEANVTTYSAGSDQVSGEKPEASVAYERVSEVVKTIAAWIPATKRALSDAAQIRGLIDSELRADLAEELEDQMLNGDGVGENFTGLANTANVLVQTWDTDIVTTSRKAITNLLINGRQSPTGFLMSPQDWELFDLAQDDQGRYYWGGPVSMGPRTLWGVPVAQSFFQTQGTAWLGNWRKAVLWDREQANISVSDSHSDFFIRNMVAILAELRAAFGIIRPTGFVEVDLTSGS